MVQTVETLALRVEDLVAMQWDHADVHLQRLGVAVGLAQAPDYVVGSRW